MAEKLKFEIEISNNGGFKTVLVDADDFDAAVKRVKEDVDKLDDSLINSAQTSQIFQNLSSAINQVQSAFKQLTDAYTVQEHAETLLAQAMRNMMDASDDEISWIEVNCSAKQSDKFSRCNDFGMIDSSFKKVLITGHNDITASCKRRSIYGSVINITDLSFRGGLYIRNWNYLNTSGYGRNKRIECIQLVRKLFAECPDKLINILLANDGNVIAGHRRLINSVRHTSGDESC